MSAGTQETVPTYRSIADVPRTDSNGASGGGDGAWASSAVSTVSAVSAAIGSRHAQPQLPLSDDGSPPSTHKVIRFIDECYDQIQRGSPVDFGTFVAGLDAFKHQNGIGLDDRKMLLEKILVFLSRIPPGSDLGTKVEHYLIDFLYKDLPHPPSTFLGPLMPSTPSNANILGLKGFAYREPDGSSNNPLIPQLGAAHTPYARSVASSHVAPISTLPDPGVVFDTLLKRDSEAKLHPTGLSSMFFAFANLIIHSLFRTNPRDWSRNETSSYLDLSPLYGVDEAEQMTVRKVDGTGRLHEDVFADKRILGMPPSVSALLVIFSRNHNFVATRLLNINERGTFKRRPANEEELKKQDDEIFNRARLVNCGTFMQVIMRDYVGSILRMIPDLSPWHLRPLDAIRDSHHEFTPRGEGNVCSVEFNLLYRWHATTSKKDEKWIEGVWKKLFPGKEYDQINPMDFIKGVGRSLDQGADPKKWTFGELQRNRDTNRFDDTALAKLLQSATDDAANAFRAHGTPAAFRVIEILGIQQSRAWGVCSLNEFRSFLGLKPYSSFKEWNPLPAVHVPAEKLYHHIDNMELYVGMQAEETRPSEPGSGLCSGYTMSRSILADAVALIRGDRFLTIEYTPFNLTSWGFRDAETYDTNGSLGGMLTKLLFRNLPQHYSAASIYAHFPLMVPERMKDFMLEKDKDMVKSYDWERPHTAPTIRTVDSFAAVKEVVTEVAAFGTAYEALAATRTNGYGFYLGSSNDKKSRDRAMIQRALFTPEAITQHKQFYYEKTKDLIADKAFSPVGAATKTVDIVHDVINYIPVHWVATRVAGLPLRTPENPEAKYSEEELYGYLAVLFEYIYLNTEPVNAWFLDHESSKAGKLLLEDISHKLKHPSILSVQGIREKVTGLFASSAESKGSDAFLHQLCSTNSDREHDEFIYNVFGIIINSVANWAHAMTHVVNFYLDEERKHEKDAIVALANRSVTEETEGLLIGYAREALRLDPPVAGVFRDVHADVRVHGTHLGKGEKVVVNLANALVDVDHFGPDASKVNPRRPRAEQSFSFVAGAHTSLDEDFSEKTMAHVLRAVYSKKNLRRAEGISGKLTRFTEDAHGTCQTLYIDTKGQVTRWPQSLLVQFDN